MKLQWAKPRLHLSGTCVCVGGPTGLFQFLMGSGIKALALMIVTQPTIQKCARFLDSIVVNKDIFFVCLKIVALLCAQVGLGMTLIVRDLRSEYMDAMPPLKQIKLHS